MQHKKVLREPKRLSGDRNGWPGFRSMRRIGAARCDFFVVAPAEAGNQQGRFFNLSVF
jgi:hypothetical protein